ncbi:MAG: hypothetical protein ACOCY0_01770 [Roseicyclus sp.]
MLAGGMSETGVFGSVGGYPIPEVNLLNQRLPHGRDGGQPRRDLPQRLHRRLARGARAIGILIDYTPRYPETVFANAIWNCGPTIEAIVADIRAGNPTGRDFTECSFMEYGGNELIYVSDMVRTEAIPAMEEKRAMIEAGDFEVPIDAEEPA